MKSNIVDYINILSNFCGKRDIKALTKEELINKYNIDNAEINSYFLVFIILLLYSSLYFHLYILH